MAELLEVRAKNCAFDEGASFRFTKIVAGSSYEFVSD